MIELAAKASIAYYIIIHRRAELPPNRRVDDGLVVRQYWLEVLASTREVTFQQHVQLACPTARP